MFRFKDCAPLFIKNMMPQSNVLSSGIVAQGAGLKAQGKSNTGGAGARLTFKFDLKY
jgi:hypothetical protein